MERKGKDYAALKDDALYKAVLNKQIIKQSSQGNFGMYDVMPVNNARIVSEACDRFFKRRNIISRSAWLSPSNRKNKIQQAKDERNTNS